VVETIPNKLQCAKAISTIRAQKVERVQREDFGNFCDVIVDFISENNVKTVEIHNSHIDNTCAKRPARKQRDCDIVNLSLYSAQLL